MGVMSEPDLPPGYPSAWEADVVLRDGSVCHVRPIKPSDGPGLHRFHAGQSAESIYLRFFAPLRELSERDVHHFTHVDYVDRVALVATIRDDIIGVGRFDKVDERSAEVAFNIGDSYQGKGIGSVLLEHLAAIARDLGIAEFTAEVLPQNRKMLQVFADAGYAVSRHFDDGVISLHFEIEPTDKSTAVAMSREHRAEAVSVKTLLAPRSVAVIGASHRKRGIGHRFLKNLIAAGFTGSLAAVHPEADEILTVPCYRSIGDVPAAVDLAVIAVPAPSVLDVVDECALAGVKALLVVSAGFAEVDTAGAERQAALVRRARGAGMRVIGPNSFGLINNDPAIRLNASLAKAVPPPGHLGLFSQSGALGVAVLASAARRNLGISTFASVGNRVDVSANDLMQYWIDDDDTRAVGLYLESMGNPRKFSRVARNLGRIKPVIVVKPGVSNYGTPPGHRVRRTKARPEVFDAMLRQAGVIRVDNIHQLFDVAQLVVHQPRPKGNRVAIVTNSDALGSLSAEAALAGGLEIAREPVNLPPDASAQEFRSCLDAAFADPGVDSVIACFVPPLTTMDEDVARAVRAAASESDKPCCATFLGMRGVSDGHASVRGTGEGELPAIPVYAMPEDAVRALCAATQYAAWRRSDHGVAPVIRGINRRLAEDVAETVLSVTPQGRRLSSAEAGDLLTAYGIDVWPIEAVASADEAVAAAERIGYPVVLKSRSHRVRHQRGTSGVRVDLASEHALREAWTSLEGHLTPLDASDFVIQKMAPPGVPTVISSDEDPLFGPVIAFSIAGIPTELIGDIGYRIPPLTDVTVAELISAPKAAPVLHGHRGAAPVDRAALADVIARVSVLADDMPEVASLALNPVNAHSGGIEVLGADITIAPAPRRTDPGRRSLT